ncbi:hypothetical protein Tco_1121038 [Tanacetum coccineum]|uniref:Uncharacterized protein n=1 Tax=Tanacetum coccineum TaxID=301880 RepID=A0ABQ5IZH3_9ASTR
MPLLAVVNPNAPFMAAVNPNTPVWLQNRRNKRPYGLLCPDLNAPNGRLHANLNTLFNHVEAFVECDSAVVVRHEMREVGGDDDEVEMVRRVAWSSGSGWRRRGILAGKRLPEKQPGAAAAGGGAGNGEEGGGRILGYVCVFMMKEMEVFNI